MLWFFPSILLCRAYVLLPLRASSLEIKLFKICISEIPLCISSCLNGSWLHIEFYSYSIIGQSLGIFRITLCLPNLCWLSFKPILAFWMNLMSSGHCFQVPPMCFDVGNGWASPFHILHCGEIFLMYFFGDFTPTLISLIWNPVSWASWMDALSCFAFLSLFCSLSCMYL